MKWNERYIKEAGLPELVSLLTPAAIIAQPFIVNKINKHNEKKHQEEEEAREQEAKDYNDKNIKGYM
jgi:hypothetical protein